MNQLSELLKESFDLFVKMRWLKTIRKETAKCDALKSKLDSQRYVVQSLVKRYSEIYGDWREDKQ